MSQEPSQINCRHNECHSTPYTTECKESLRRAKKGVRRAVLCMVREGISDKLTFDQRFKGHGCEAYGYLEEDCAKRENPEV